MSHRVIVEDQMMRHKEGDFIIIMCYINIELLC